VTQIPRKSNEQKRAEQANLLISHNNAFVKTAHFFQQKFDVKWVRS